MSHTTRTRRVAGASAQPRVRAPGFAPRADRQLVFVAGAPGGRADGLR